MNERRAGNNSLFAPLLSAILLPCLPIKTPSLCKGAELVFDFDLKKFIK